MQLYNNQRSAAMQNQPAYQFNQFNYNEHNIRVMKEEFDRSWKHFSALMDMQSNESQQIVNKNIRKEEMDLFIDNNIKETKQ